MKCPAKMSLDQCCQLTGPKTDNTGLDGAGAPRGVDRLVPMIIENVRLLRIF